MAVANLKGYRAHWRLLRECLGRGQHKSRVVNALALLMESGAIYCILIVSIAYLASNGNALS